MDPKKQIESRPCGSAAGRKKERKEAKQRQHGREIHARKAEARSPSKAAGAEVGR